MNRQAPATPWPKKLVAQPNAGVHTAKPSAPNSAAPRPMPRFRASQYIVAAAAAASSAAEKITPAQTDNR